MLWRFACCFWLIWCGILFCWRCFPKSSRNLCSDIKYIHSVPSLHVCLCVHVFSDLIFSSFVDHHHDAHSFLHIDCYMSHDHSCHNPLKHVSHAKHYNHDICLNFDISLIIHGFESRVDAYQWRIYFRTNVAHMNASWSRCFILIALKQERYSFDYANIDFSILCGFLSRIYLHW